MWRFVAFCHAQAQDRDSVPVPVAVASVRFDGTAARTSVQSLVSTSTSSTTPEQEQSACGERGARRGAIST